MRSGQVSFVERLNPQLFGRRSRPARASRPTQTPVVAEPARAAEHRVRPAGRQARAPGGRDWPSTTTASIAALKGSATRQVGVVPPGLSGPRRPLPLLDDEHRPGARRCSSRPGYGPGGKKLTLLLTHVQGDSDEELVSALIKSNLAPLNIDLQVQALQWHGPVGQGQVGQPDQAPGHLPLLLVARLRRPVLVVHQPVPLRGPSRSTTSRTTRTRRLTPRSSWQRSRGRAARRSIAPVRGRAEDAADDGVVAPLYVQQYQRVIAKSRDRLRRQPRLSQRRLRLQPDARSDVTAFLARRLAQAAVRGGGRRGAHVRGRPAGAGRPGGELGRPAARRRRSWRRPATSSGSTTRCRCRSRSGSRGSLSGDWGTSVHTHQPVLSDIATRAPASVELVVAGAGPGARGRAAARAAGGPLRGRAPDVAVRLIAVVGGVDAGLLARADPAARVLPAARLAAGRRASTRRASTTRSPLDVRTHHGASTR